MSIDTQKNVNILPALKEFYFYNMAKKYIPDDKEKYMNAKQKAYFKKRLMEWKNEVIKSNTNSMYLNDVDNEISSSDVVDQASSQTEKAVGMRTLNRQIKLISKIDKAIKRIQDNTYGYCEETGEPIGVKRLIARPIATLSIEAQEKHERNEKIYADT
tara:strand:+ start:1044 stop:1517 length:474 start_codon:yes stop_codon:yes gene_type:complete